MSLLERTVHDFLAGLASADPTPGGGSASALAAAEGAALVAMVARLSQRDTPEAAAAVERAERLRTELAELVDADARAFEAVMTAYRLPKATSEEQVRRREAVQQALLAASEVPLQVIARAVEVLAAAGDLVARANPNAISDLGVAAVLAEASAAGAGLNVMINTRNMNDETIAAGLRERAARSQAEAQRLRAAIVAAVTRRLGPV